MAGKDIGRIDPSELYINSDPQKHKEFVIEDVERQVSTKCVFN
jgi:hypothetical protein